MSYQVLARKWRPKTFHEMVGQEHVLKALINALDNNRLHHAYLFTGTRGVGKTTIARILAKCLNCEAGVSAEPCGQCSACLSINEGRFVDLIEVDAASRTKVEDTRELLDNVQYAPTNGRFKVYLIDEVHMLSTHSFNALLKTLEEPPPHVKFLLATTDPQKLPATILSRCLQFNLKNLSPERIVDYLKNVLTEEQVSFEEAALWLLGRAADGSMRDAMSLADQAISFGSGSLKEEDVRDMLGTIDQTAVYGIVEALGAGNGAQLLQAVQALSEHAPDFSLAMEEVLSLLHRIAIAQAVPGSLDNALGDRERVEALAAGLSAEDVQLFYQLGLTGRRDLGLAPDPRTGFEMALLRMLAFRPAVAAAAAPRTDTPSDPSPVDPQKLSPGAPEAPARAKKSEAAVGASAAVAEPTHARPLAPIEQDQADKERVDEQSVQNPRATPEPSISRTTVARQADETVNPAPEGKDVAGKPTLEDLSADSWSRLFPQLGFGGVVGNIASHCLLERRESTAFFLILDENNATLFNEQTPERIADHLSLVLETPVKVAVRTGPVSAETPAVRKQRLQAERRQQALQALQNDPNIQALISDFDGVLDTDSVTPV